MNQTFNFSEYFFERIGSSYLSDSLFLTLIPIGLFGFILNTISLIVFAKIKIKQTKMYSYLFLNTMLSSLLGCAMIMVASLPYSTRYFGQISFNFIIRIVRCRILNYMGASQYLWSNLIDIIIALSRLSAFMKPISVINKYSPIKIVCLLLLSSYLINLPMAFWYQTQTDEEFFESMTQTSLKSFTYCKTSSFLSTRFGLITTILSSFIRDILTLLFEIVISILALIFLKKFIKNKNFLKRFKRKTTILQQINENNVNNNNNLEDLRDREVYLNSLKLTFWLLATATLIHLITLILTIVTIIDTLNFKTTDSLSVFYIYFLFALKHITSFFIFLNFNSNFKIIFYNMFKIK
jgi:hypothetical protein